MNLGLPLAISPPLGPLSLSLSLFLYLSPIVYLCTVSLLGTRRAVSINGLAGKPTSSASAAATAAAARVVASKASGAQKEMREKKKEN